MKTKEYKEFSRDGRVVKTEKIDNEIQYHINVAMLDNTNCIFWEMKEGILKMLEKKYPLFYKKEIGDNIWNKVKESFIYQYTDLKGCDKHTETLERRKKLFEKVKETKEYKNYNDFIDECDVLYETIKEGEVLNWFILEELINEKIETSKE
jgi:hypothetical protein